MRQTVSLVLFLGLAGAVNLWSTHHLGHGIKNPGVLAALMGGVGLGSNWLLSAAEKSSASDQARRLARRLISPPLLIALYLAAAVLGASYSSVLVVAPVGEETVVASLVELEGAGPSDSNKEHELPESEGPQRRFKWVRTTPFGREYRLHVRGYLPEVIAVHPIFSKTVQPERDLRPAPSVLFRPPVESFDYIGATSGCVVLCTNCPRDITCFTEAEPADGVLAIVREARSVLVGSADASPNSISTDWQLELTVSQADDDAVAEALLAWKNPLVIGRELEPGSAVTARILSRRGRNLGESTVTVGAQRLVDRRIEFRR